MHSEKTLYPAPAQLRPSPVPLGRTVSDGLLRAGRAYLAGWEWYVRSGLSAPGAHGFPLPRR